MTGWDELDRFLQTDPRDVGCGEALRLLHVYVDLIINEGADEATRRHPGIAAHLHACGPCNEDFEGLLLAVESNDPAGRPEDRS